MLITKKHYKEWLKNKSINPITKRKLKKDGKIYNRFKNYINFDIGCFSKGPKNEDRYVIEKYGNKFFIAILDGHGGDRCVKFCEMHLFRIFKNVKDKSISIKLKKTYFELENLYKKYVEKYAPNDSSGTTMSILVVDEKNYHASNVGDSRIIGFLNKKVIALTLDHKPNLEFQRIQNIGDTIRFSGTYRIGSLAISRVIGDFDLKKQYKSIIAIPDIKNGKNTKNSIFVLASDGLYDVMSNNEIIRFVQQNNNIENLDILARKLVEYAISAKKSTDDVTVIVVKK